MRNMRYAFGARLAITLAFLGCSHSGQTSRDASVEQGGTVDTGTGTVDTDIVESGVDIPDEAIPPRDASVERDGTVDGGGGGNADCGSDAVVADIGVADTPVDSTGGCNSGGSGDASACSCAPMNCPSPPTNGDFSCYEELGYCRFLVESYPKGLRDPSWGGVYSTFTPGLACDGNPACGDHRVCSESTSLLALLAALRGDQATFDQMQQIWFDPNRHYSAKNHLAHWVLDSNGSKLPEPIPNSNGSSLSGYLNASGEEVRMLLALVRAAAMFDLGSSGPYHSKAQELGTSMREKLFGTADDPGNPYLLRPWWVWSTEADEHHLLTGPDRSSLNIMIPLAYYQASIATWLPQELRNYFTQVLATTLSTITGCAQEQMFKPQYVLATSSCADEVGTPGGCQVLACADIAARLADYTNVAGLQPDARAKAYLDFLEAKYRGDGVLWNAYAFSDGQPLSTTLSSPYASLVDYVFLAKLAMSFERWDLAEKILMEQVIPNQVFPSNDHPSGAEEKYLGAIKPRLADVTSCWDDAQAFPNIEAMTALHAWNVTPKNGWTSTYPQWVTVYPEKSTGGTDTIQFLEEVETRYIRLLLKKRGGAWGNYSLYEVKASGSGGPLEIKSASASSVQWDNGTPPSKAWTTNLVFDGDTTYSRWSSSKDNSNPQWIYVDFGAKKKVSKLVISWENAYAAEYDVQLAETP